MAVLFFVLAAAGCTAENPDHDTEADKLRIINDNAPREVRTAVVTIASECRVPSASIELFHNMEQWVKQEWIIELPHAQASSGAVTKCIEAKINSLGLSSKFTWGELPPPPPPGSQMQDAYLFIAAERHVDDPKDAPPIQNARILLPEVLRKCGVEKFHQEDIADGIFALRFNVLPKDATNRISCIQREEPRGAWVQEAHL